MGFWIYDFPVAAPGATVVQVIYPDNLPGEKADQIKSTLDGYYRQYRNSDLLHLVFRGVLDGLQLAGLITSYREDVAVPRGSFGGYRCAYQGQAVPADPIPKPSRSRSTKGAQPAPSPLDALLQPQAWEGSSRDDLSGTRPPEEAWDVPPGMVAE